MATKHDKWEVQAAVQEAQELLIAAPHHQK